MPVPPPKLKPPAVVTSVLGVHSHFNINLSSEFLYEPSAAFPRQGDILDAQNDVFARLNERISIRPTHWIILSQTCVVDNHHYSSVLPAYRSSALEQADISKLGIKPAHLRKAGAIDNMLPRILSWPPDERLAIEDDRLHVDLSQTHSLESSDLKKAEIIASLTFPANAYFCSRVAMWLFRDVERWDDERKSK